MTYEEKLVRTISSLVRNYRVIFGDLTTLSAKFKYSFEELQHETVILTISQLALSFSGLKAVIKTIFSCECVTRMYFSNTDSEIRVLLNC